MSRLDTEKHFNVLFLCAGACRMLNQRIGIFASLPIEQLDRLALKLRMDGVGQTQTTQEPA